MNVRLDHGAAGTVTGQPSAPRAGRQIPWLSRRPCGTSRSRRWLGESPRRLRPTCSNMPMGRTDGVERTVVDVAVVLQPDVHLAGQPGLLDPLDAGLDLARRHGHPNDLDAVVLRGVQGHRPPAAADVQEPHARAEGQLLAHQLELGLLGRLSPTVGSSQTAHEYVIDGPSISR